MTEAAMWIYVLELHYSKHWKNTYAITCNENNTSLQINLQNLN